MKTQVETKRRGGRGRYIDIETETDGKTFYLKKLPYKAFVCEFIFASIFSFFFLIYQEVKIKL